MEQLKKCPLCSGERISHHLTIPDYFLSKENFSVSKCLDCGFIFTNPRPTKNDISFYYKSDDYISHSNKNTGLISFFYKIVRNYSLRQKFNLISKFKSPGHLLDIGCGTGEFLHFMHLHNWHTTGIEPAQEPRYFAVNNYLLDVFDEEVLSSLAPESFDLITLWHVLEHVEDLKLRIQQIKKLLKKDGLLIIALPNCLSWDAQHYKNFWAAWDLPRHRYHFTPSTIHLLLRKYQFNIFYVHPLKFDSYYISLLSEKYKHGKPNFMRAFLNGFRSNFSAKRNGNNYSSLVYFIKNENS
ncbi:MAG TPA: class I SAM-dependent methyltransferase [Bacteroidales bacterium]|nr:class I SAM-dependent methyltransferase [Bacteroidales bacterium]